MLMLIRWLSKLIKRERDVLNRYQRSHPHFLRYIVVDALISIAVVVGAYQLWSMGASTAGSASRMGMNLDSAKDLVKNARSGDIDTFWIGPIKGARYTLNDEVLRIADLFYWPESSGDRDPKGFLFEVKTYESQNVWDSHTHPIVTKINTTTVTLTPNISIKINRTSMRGVIVTYADKPEIVAIRYPQSQTLASMVKNVESLKLVR